MHWTFLLDNDANLNFFVHHFQETPSASYSTTSSHSSNKYINTAQSILPYFRSSGFKVDLQFMQEKILIKCIYKDKH